MGNHSRPGCQPVLPARVNILCRLLLPSPSADGCPISPYLPTSTPFAHVTASPLPVPQREARSSPHTDAHTCVSAPYLSHLPLSTLIAIASSLLSHLSLIHHLNHPLPSPLSDPLCPNLLSPPLLPSSLSSSSPSSLPSTIATIPSLLHSLRSSIPLPSLRQLYSIPLLPPPPPSPPPSLSPPSSPSFLSHHSLHLLLALLPTKAPASPSPCHLPSSPPTRRDFPPCSIPLSAHLPPPLPQHHLRFPRHLHHHPV
ncbi:unnamed protein product [Closterium sp. NIES-65]|nr:unnamed protein product [Closterium sp. NIES-65]